MSSPAPSARSVARSVRAVGDGNSVTDPSHHMRGDRVRAKRSRDWGQVVVDRPDQAFGIDIGGSGIKGAIVNTSTGELATERVRVATPQPSTPESVAAVVAQLVQQADWHGVIGATFPAVIQ